MITLQFTEEEIELLLRALSIAESTFAEQREQYIKATKGRCTGSVVRKETEAMLELSNSMYNLFHAIESGEKDVPK